jgi:hypothetical protein
LYSDSRPRKSFATDYSYRTQRQHQEQLQLLQHWVAGLRPLLFPKAESFSLDFHPIPYRGEEAVLDQHYQPRRGRAGPSVLAFFAQERTSQVLGYANANLTRDRQDAAVLRSTAMREPGSHSTGWEPSGLRFALIGVSD